jgi:hypothetical protein
MALVSLPFLLTLTDGFTSLSSIDGVAVAPVPSLLDRGYLTEPVRYTSATLAQATEAVGLAPLLARLTLFGG